MHRYFTSYLIKSEKYQKVLFCVQVNVVCIYLGRQSCYSADSSFKLWMHFEKDEREAPAWLYNTFLFLLVSNKHEHVGGLMKVVEHLIVKSPHI